ncbi:MAG: Vps62-related protein [Solirubrobacteraceae bacterium]|nr:Vps62-related protein [Solirubrobacteraceae bacterium]
MLAVAALTSALAANAPVVVHDSREQFPLSSVAAASVVVPGRDGDRRSAVYGRATPAAGGGAWLQYWLFYAGNDQDRGIVRTGRHEGDWEMVQYRLDRTGRPVEAVYAQHSIAERCAWSAVEQRGGRPVVYAAHGSHASYLRAGTRDRMWPDPNDEADGRGEIVRPRLVAVSASTPPWMRWSGRWGGAEAAWWNPAEQDSPTGPAFQQQGRWSDPDAWARAATPCRAACDEVGECDDKETLMGVGMAGLATLLGLLSVRWWRRRRTASRLQDDLPHRPA